jgi:hypothetical protein
LFFFILCSFSLPRKNKYRWISVDSHSSLLQTSKLEIPPHLSVAEEEEEERKKLKFGSGIVRIDKTNVGESSINNLDSFEEYLYFSVLGYCPPQGL